MTQTRQPSGIPIGGQFAAGTQRRASVALGRPAVKPPKPMTITNLGLRPAKGDQLIRLTDTAGDTWVGTTKHLVREGALDTGNQLTATTLAERVDTPSLQPAFVASMFSRAAGDLTDELGTGGDELFAYSVVLDGIAGPGSIEPGRVFHERFVIPADVADAWEKTGHEIRFSRTGKMWSAWRDGQMNALHYAVKGGSW